ncbi:MAG: endo-1,4-beta-xylanase, partial [Planctomycetota bacterium]
MPRTAPPYITPTIAAAVIAFGGSAQNFITNPGFENGQSPWIQTGSTLSVVSDSPFEGAFHGRVTSRNNWTSGPAQDFSATLPSGTILLVTGAGRIDGPEADDIQGRIRTNDGQTTQGFTAARRTSQPGEWVTLRGIFPFVYEGPQPDLRLLVQTRFDGADGDPADPFSFDDWSVTVYEEDPNWRQLADAGIEQHRKRDLEIRVVDVNGATVGDSTLNIAQVRHHFAFGATLEAPELQANNVPYMEMFPTLFEWATPRNAFKWRQTERNRDQPDWSRPDAVVQFCEANDLDIYGHNIFWAAEKNLPDWLPGLSDARVVGELQERIDELLGRYADDVDHWDVNNEMLHVSYLTDRLDPIPCSICPIRPWMFHRAAQLDPSAKLFLNDFSVVGGGLNGAEAENYADQAQGFLDAGMPVHGIGAQCHFNNRPIIARWIRERLDILAAVGLPIRLTEFDLLRPDVNERADDLEKFYRVAFSHPAVDGVTLWGWWAGNHGIGPDAAIVDTDFTLNEAGQRYVDLLSEWATNESLPTGTGGIVELRGFHGEYEVSLDSPAYDAAPIPISLEPGAGTSQATVIVIGA